MIFIPGPPPSSKNSRIFNSKTKRSFPSKTTQKYIKESKPYWLQYRDEFLEMVKDKPKPYLIGFHYVRATKHKWDFINSLQMSQDLMAEYNWIDDDNTDEMFPIPFALEDKGSLYSYDKEKPGVYITIL